MRWKSPWLTAALTMLGSLGVQSTMPITRTAQADDTAYVGDLDDSAATAEVSTADYPPTYAAPMPQYGQTYNQPAAYSSRARRPMTTSNYRRAATCDSGWGSLETLLWFPMSREVQPLITQANAPSAPIPGSPGYQVLFGGSIEDGLTPGMRFDAGRYFGRDKLVGFGGRVYGILDSSTSVTAASDANGAPSIGRFYYNIFDTQLLGVNQVSGVAQQNINGTPFLTGAARGTSELNFMGSDIYGRLVLTRSNENQIDMLGGFTSASIDDNIIIDSVTNQFDINQVLVNTFLIRDMFETDNTFYGAHLGMDARIDHGGWYLSMMTKVNFGNMHQRVNRVGANIINGVPGNIGVLNTQDLGVFERDVFTFAPEMNLKFGLKLRSNIIATVGYSFMYWDRVALSNDQIDPRVDPNGIIPTGPFTIKDNGFFMHGVDLGLTVNY